MNKQNREAIIRELEWLVANAKENDNVFIYYSGHGEYKKELSKGYWVPVDAETQSTSKYISNSDIQTYINGIKSKHTLLVSDACFSGDIFRGNTLSVPFEESEKYYREVHSLPFKTSTHFRWLRACNGWRERWTFCFCVLFFKIP
jgi:hypothetical protein